MRETANVNIYSIESIPGALLVDIAEGKALTEPEELIDYPIIAIADSHNNGVMAASRIFASTDIPRIGVFINGDSIYLCTPDGTPGADEITKLMNEINPKIDGISVSEEVNDG